MINAFLPSDFASEFELAQVGETEVHALQYGVEDVANHLLKQPFSVFLDKLSGDESVRKYIDTFAICGSSYGSSRKNCIF